MKKYLEKLPKELRDLISLASETAHSNNMSVYLIGGFVRDLILGVRNLDLDIVVEGDGIKFAEILSEKLDAALTRHKRFGTATVTLKKHLKIDVATARKEYYPHPAQLPEVACGILKDDLLRRDFSINAMAISLNKHDFGTFVDCFGGRNDLTDKKVRVLHPLSFIDDPTRILRAIRFEQRFNFRIEPKTLKLLKEACKLKMLEKVQPQRLRDEIILVLKEERPIKELKRIKELAGFGFIYPRLVLSKDILAFLKNAENQVNWFRRAYPKRRSLDAWLIYFIALVSRLGSSDIKSLCRRFAFRKGEEKRILAYKKIKAGFLKELSRPGTKPSKLFGLLEPLSYEVIILLKAKSRNAVFNKHLQDFLRAYNGTRIHIGGEDLRKLGLTPGPFYQRIFKRVLDAKLNGLARTREEELELLRKITFGIKLPSGF